MDLNSLTETHGNLHSGRPLLFGFSIQKNGGN